MSKIPKREFLGDAVSYQQARPSYPEALFRFLLDFWQPTTNEYKPVFVDVGCGTGIATRGIYRAFEKKGQVIGIDPDLKMLEQARKTEPTDDVTYLEGNAESLPFENQTIDIVMVAQSMQYFDRPIFYQEAKRILKNNGVIAIIENNRDWKSSQFLEKYEEFLENNANHYSRNYRVFPFIEELSVRFHQPKEKPFPWSRKMTPHDFWVMVKSTTSGKEAIANLGEEKVAHSILELANAYLDNKGMLDIPYISKAYLAKKF